MKARPLQLLAFFNNQENLFMLESSLKTSSLDHSLTPIKWPEEETTFSNLTDFDLILLDNTADNNGIEKAKRIHHHVPEIPVILFIEEITSQFEEKAIEAGIYDYHIVHSYSPNDLDRSIRYTIEKSRVERILKNNERKFRSLFENASEYIFITDDKFRITEVNTSAIKLFKENGYLSLPGRHITEFLSGEQIGQALDQKNTEVILKLNEDCEKNCLLNIQTTTIPLNSMQFVLHDITERKLLEEKHKQLEKRELTERFTKILAHEIKNPLTNINLSLVELHHLIDSKDEEIQQLLEIIKRNSIRINTLLEDLLTATGPIYTNKILLPADDLFYELFYSSQDRLLLKKIKFIKKIEAGIVIYADKKLIAIALLNLILNGIESISENGMIQVKVKNKNKEVIIIISDNGEGIPAGEIDRIFEPFYSKKAGGTGLGLAATHNIINMHGGTISVESKEKKGTSFIISLPQKPEPILSK